MTKEKKRQGAPTAISLFSGAGGMDIGFEQAGFSILWANEMNKHAADTYALNRTSGIIKFGRLEDSIDDLFSLKGKTDCLFGGPPCQGFSVAGKMSPDDPRSEMVFLFMKAVDIVRPKAFVMENVAALATLGKFENVMKELFSKANRMGYSTFLRTVNAKNVGIPQSRERMFLIGFRDGKDRQKHFDDHIENARCNSPTVREILLSLPPIGRDDNPETCKAKIVLAKNPILRKSPYAGMLFNGLGRPINLDGHSCTLPASMGGNKTPIIDENSLRTNSASWVENMHSAILKGEPIGDIPKNLRRLSVVEAAALQTFPDTYRFSGPVTAQYAQIGNAVPCRLAKTIASFVKSKLYD